MTPEQFVYWLQGFMEVGNPSTLSRKQVLQIKDHLSLVFDKEIPNRWSPPVSDSHHPTTTLPHTPPPQILCSGKSGGGLKC